MGKEARGQEERRKVNQKTTHVDSIENRFWWQGGHWGGGKSRNLGEGVGGEIVGGPGRKTTRVLPKAWLTLGADGYACR